MNKQMKWITAVLFAVMMMGMIGCASSPPVESERDWILNPPVDNENFYAMGAAELADEARAWQIATFRARQDLALTVNDMIEAMQIEYGERTGSFAAGVDYWSSVGQQLTSVTLSGSEVVKRDTRPGSMYYVWVRYPRASMRTAAVNIIRKEAAENLLIDVTQALEAMEKALSKN
jgi:hypothetical protein